MNCRYSILHHPQQLSPHDRAPILYSCGGSHPTRRTPHLQLQRPSPFPNVSSELWKHENYLSTTIIIYSDSFQMSSVFWNKSLRLGDFLTIDCKVRTQQLYVFSHLFYMCPKIPRNTIKYHILSDILLWVLFWLTPRLLWSGSIASQVWVVSSLSCLSCTI